MYRVFVCGQTAWKGGGFGMFSTVDAENARFLKAYLITEEGELPLPIPMLLKKRSAELRAAPSENALQELTRKLAKLSWCHTQADWANVAHATGIASAKAEPVTAQVLHATDRSEGKSWQFAIPGASSMLEPITGYDRPREIPYQAVRVELWRYRWNRDTKILQAEQWMSTTTQREDS
jgi:hypothetical protein